MDDESAVKNSMGKLFEAHIDDVQNTQIGIFAMRKESLGFNMEKGLNNEYRLSYSLL